MILKILLRTKLTLLTSTTFDTKSQGTSQLIVGIISYKVTNTKTISNILKLGWYLDSKVLLMQLLMSKEA